MMRHVLSLVISSSLGMCAAGAVAQPPPPPPPPPPPGAYYPPGPTAQRPPPPPTEASAYRNGFTFQLSLGVGYQVVSPDGGDGDSAVGLAGLNLGIGGFLSPDFALLFRISGTSAFYEAPGVTLRVTSGVGVLAAQYWPTDVFKLEGGLGFAAITAEAASGGFVIIGDDQGLGVLLGAAFQLFHSYGHSFEIGVEYAPGFFEGGTVHNMGVVFGWQML